MLYMDSYSVIPIIKIMDDTNHSRMVIDIVKGEFERNKDKITIDRYLLANNYVNDEIDFFDIYRTEEELNIFINKALKILWGV